MVVTPRAMIVTPSWDEEAEDVEAADPLQVKIPAPNCALCYQPESVLYMISRPPRRPHVAVVGSGERGQRRACEICPPPPREVGKVVG